MHGQCVYVFTNLDNVVKFFTVSCNIGKKSIALLSPFLVPPHFIATTVHSYSYT